VKSLPESIKKNKEAVAATIENNVRKLIIDESPINPKYYEKMSERLDALIAQRKQAALDDAAYLAKIVELTKQVLKGTDGSAYPKSPDSPAKRALYDNFGKNEKFVILVHDSVRALGQDDWRGNIFKVKKVRGAIRTAVEMFKVERSNLAWIIKDSTGDKGEVSDDLVREILELVTKQHEY
jgi:type I restriction enzyme, R subunit